MGKLGPQLKEYIKGNERTWLTKKKASLISKRVTKDIIMYRLARKAQSVQGWPKSLPKCYGV